ncbi:MAG: 5-oxoprolinase subunit PxpA [Sphingobacteriales bacterium]|uniref:5-oxoprolinase subunit PxpA n=1 Tax=Hydrotalea flava TaxID=714549 RepID=UPI0008299406|nr:5-oxoprolinase subunit PxpA [Hydrotalea flava]RTL52397.1 MAG: 5-oxoprolinase subunit PxpA [Sphingobacteriales bacterium]
MLSIDLNCDLGEGMNTDALLMPYISSANIACGFHAGDAATMRKTVALCLQYGVAIGAHPGFNDKANFGRKPIPLTEPDLLVLLQQQIEALQQICEAMGATLHHIKLHGALYNMVSADAAFAERVANILHHLYPHLWVYALSGSCFINACKAKGLQTASEVFADRTYQDNCQLTPRSAPQALIETTEVALQQVLTMIQNRQVTTLSGNKIFIAADTLCLHGDGAHAVDFAKTIYYTLKQKNIGIQTL